MKFIPSQLAYLLRDPEARTNIRGLLKYVALLVALVLVYTVLIHVIKLYLEDEQFSWITGTYWTLVVMSDVE